MTTTVDKEAIKKEIEREIAENKIMVFSKGTAEIPRCGFTMQMKQFFDGYGYPYKFRDVLEDMPMREVLSEMTDWPTLPKVFINGKFYGDNDILDPMAENGELEPILKEAFGQ